MEKNTKKLHKTTAAVLGMLLILLGACSPLLKNNDSTLRELMNHMAVRVGGTYAGKVFVPPVKAMEGICMKVEGREVFFYRYDLHRVKQVRKVEQIRKNKKVYINGIPFAAVVNGSFVMIGHDTNAKQKELIEAFESF